MFSMDPELKKRVLNLVGGKLAKYGDSYDKGSAFFTKTCQILDELEHKYLLDCDPESDIMLKANGLLKPRYKSYKPILGKNKPH
jgi:hypothetical protein